MRKRVFITTILISLLVFNVAFAVDDIKEVKKSTEESKTISLTIEESVKLGLENSIDLKIVKNEIDLSALKQKRTKNLSKKLQDGDDRIRDASGQISKAQQLLNAGISPVDQKIPLGDTGKFITIKAGQPIPNNTPIPKDKIIQGIQGKIDDSKKALEGGELSLGSSLDEAGISISEKLKFETLDSLGVNSTSDLMTTMANVSYEVTNASYDIYKNKIAMLIQKNYYDVLKAQKILAVKRKAMERAKKQYEFSKDSFEVGMKAKDDMLLADVYYKSTEIEFRKAEGELENAFIELKKNLNVSLDTEIVLTDVLVDESETPDFEEGLKSGMKNRLEIKKAVGEVAIYDLNFEATKKKYPSNTYTHKEAKLLKEKKRLNYDKVFQDVETSIKQSYETLITVGDMLEKAKDMVEKARESVEIAEFKYKEGFGVESSLLKKLDLETAAGTIVEVLAAEENLSNVEEKVVQIMYSYNLAKVKYYNDAGKFIY
jgi:hypothetical protein